MRHAAEEDLLIRSLLEQGFSFDLVFDEDPDTCSLVEHVRGEERVWLVSISVCSGSSGVVWVR